MDDTYASRTLAQRIIDYAIVYAINYWEASFGRAGVSCNSHYQQPRKDSRGPSTGVFCTNTHTKEKATIILPICESK